MWIKKQSKLESKSKIDNKKMVDKVYIETNKYERDGLLQKLKGFDNKYKNIVDYILKITEEIWEKRAVWVIRDTYEEDVFIHIGARNITGINAVIDGTIDTLYSFPNRKMHGEAVIWSEEKEGSFYSSHRIGSTATNLGKTIYGDATGKNVFFRTIADCKIANNKIYEEWLVRDNLYLIEQLGFDPVEMAKKHSVYKKQNPLHINISKLLKKTNYITNIEKNCTDTYLIFNTITQLWKKGNLENITSFYTDKSKINAIGNKTFCNIQNIKEYIYDLLCSFETPIVNIERISSNRNDNQTEIAVRWHIIGKTTRKGIFNIDSKQQVLVPIISHFSVADNSIIEEWMVYDGYDVLCQIYR